MNQDSLIHFRKARCRPCWLEEGVTGRRRDWASSRVKSPMPSKGRWRERTLWKAHGMCKDWVLALFSLPNFLIITPVSSSPFFRSRDLGTEGLGHQPEVSQLAEKAVARPAGWLLRVQSLCSSLRPRSLPGCQPPACEMLGWSSSPLCRASHEKFSAKLEPEDRWGLIAQMSL